MSQEVEQNNQDSFSFVASEKKILKFWNENKIFEKSLEKTKSKAPYIFYDGPPFATGLPHHGHIVASTLKDIIPRYFTMKGFYVSRRFGWDCHGLPIEQEIDKKFGMSASDYVAKNGIKNYNSECRSIVMRYTSEWEKTISRLGRWVDFKNDYKTMDINFMESVWWVFKQCWDKNLIYKGNKIVPYSTALQTGLSNFEATQNYQDVQDPAVTVLFKMREVENTFLMAWTTTPWTLPSNLGLIINSELDYVKVKDNKKNINLILAKSRFETYAKNNELEIIETFKGETLVKKQYEPLFPYFEMLRSEGAFTIHADPYVTDGDGTGIVHAAPAFGEDDNRVLKANHVKAFICPIDEKGQFTSEVSDFSGKYIKDADKEIIKMLKDRGQLFLQSTIVHSYPFCYRTDTPLIYRALPQWYLSVDTVKEKMIAANKEINWVPDHIKDGRFGKWLENARDWAISRNRYWGTPLPIWENSENGKYICIGSIEELHKLSGVKLTDLHREFVDDITFKIAGENGIYKRIPEVLDCWFESGAMPYAQLHFPFENKEVFEKGFPAEFIAEGLDQTRGWFYTLTVLSASLYNKPAFKNVIVNGLVLAGDGKKMSKRLKNYTPPDELMEEFGADALRLFLINSGLVKGEELRFTDEGVKEMVRRALLPWYNSYKFFTTYAKVDQWSAKNHFKTNDNILDRWVLSKLQTLIKNVNFEMQNYRLYNVVPELFHFIEDLTNWYIRLNRRRFWEEGLSDDKKAAYSTLYFTLKNISILMAPFAPFLSDVIFQDLKSFGEIQEESVHLEHLPDADPKWMNPTLEDAVTRMQQVIELGRQKRIQKQIKVKTPLSTLTIIHQDKSLLNEIARLEDYIKSELNIKTIEYSTNEDQFVKLTAKPNLPVLGKRLGKNLKEYQAMILNLPSADIKKLELGGDLKIKDELFTASDFLIAREPQAGKEALSNSIITIDIDCTLNQNLIDEGLAREIVNRIQKSRKDLNFNVDDRIKVYYQGVPHLNQVVSTFGNYIKSETLTVELKELTTLNTPLKFDIDGEEISFEISKA
jgi:isoleucyl-tRNA synthetase